MNQDLCENLDRFLSGYYKEHQTSGSLRVTVQDKVIYETFLGFADAEKKTPFTKTSVFSLYSISKPFCTIGLMKLKDKNMVNLDCHPSRYVPEATQFDSRVTIRHMLHHISGLPDFVQTAKMHEKYAEGLLPHIKERIRELATYPNVFAPGTDAMYANINFIICACIIENVSGTAYGEYMQKEVFAPLGMQTAAIDHAHLTGSNRVTGYEMQNGSIIPVDRDIAWGFGAGDMIGTVDDVYCLNKAIKHKLLLKPKTWQEVLTPSPLNFMGLGCTVSDWYGKERITHNGGSRGFRTIHIQLPEDDFDIIFLSNSGWGNARNDIAEAVYQAYYGNLGKKSETLKMDQGYI